MAALKAVAVTKTYGSDQTGLTHALRGVSFAVERGEFVAIMGPSGSGKTTLLNIMAGIDVRSGGSVSVGGEELSALSGEALAKFRREHLGFVFQDYNLLDTLTLGENVALPLLLASRPDMLRVKEVMSFLGIDQISSRFPFQASGGQQQRAAVARAIVHRPAVVLADEPSCNLDSAAAAALFEQFRLLNVEHAVTIVMVTHDASAASHARRVLVLRDGRLHAELRQDEDPKPAFYDRIVGTMAQLESGH